MLLSGLNNVTASLYTQLAAIKGQRGQSAAEGAKGNHEVVKDASSVVTLSDAAKALASSKQLTFEEVGKQAREKLDEIIKQTAEKQGVPISQVNLARSHLDGVDWSRFSDQELAAIKLDREGLFNDEESLTASGHLTKRMTESLRPFDRFITMAHDERFSCTARLALYEQMTPEVREALHFTPDIVAANYQYLSRDTQKFGSLFGSDITGIVQQLAGLSTRGGLTYALTGTLFDQPGLFGSAKSAGGGWF